jgi:hypothetical protein
MFKDAKQRASSIAAWFGALMVGGALGLVDEIRIALRPLVINGGLPLFNQLEAKLSLELGKVKAIPEVTHLRHRVVK